MSELLFVFYCVYLFDVLDAKIWQRHFIYFVVYEITFFFF